MALSKTSIPLLMIAILITLMSTACANTKGQKDENDLTNPDAMVVIETNKGNIEIELWPEIAPKAVDNFLKLSREKYYEGTYFHRVIPDFMIQGGCSYTKDDDRSNDGEGNPGYTFEDETYWYEGTTITGAIVDDDMAFMIWEEVIVPYIETAPEPDPEIMKIFETVMDQDDGVAIMANNVEYYLQKTGHGPLDEKALRHSVEYGTICMANSGPNTNGSQFFIVTRKAGADWLDGKHTVFGKVTKGMNVAHTIENLARDRNDNPHKGAQAKIIRMRIK